MEQSEIADVVAEPPVLYELWYIREPGDPPKMEGMSREAEPLIRNAKLASKNKLVGAWVVRQSDGMRIYPPPSLYVPWIPGGEPTTRPTTRARGGRKRR